MRIKRRNEKSEKWGQIPDLPFPFKHLIPLLEKRFHLQIQHGFLFSVTCCPFNNKYLHQWWSVDICPKVLAGLFQIYRSCHRMNLTHRIVTTIKKASSCIGSCCFSFLFLTHLSSMNQLFDGNPGESLLFIVSKLVTIWMLAVTNPALFCHPGVILTIPSLNKIPFPSRPGLPQTLGNYWISLSLRREWLWHTYNAIRKRWRSLIFLII